MHEADLRQFEICSIINLMPGTAEEAKALIPSIEVSPFYALPSLEDCLTVNNQQSASDLQWGGQ